MNTNSNVVKTLAFYHTMVQLRSPATGEKLIFIQMVSTGDHSDHLKIQSIATLPRKHKHKHLVIVFPQSMIIFFKYMFKLQSFN